jgi:hypothetical protein
MTNHIPKPTAPANRADLKTWSAAQLEYAAPIWVAKLEAWLQEDDKLIAQCSCHPRLQLEAVNIKARRRQQLTYWKMIQDGHKTYRALPPSLRTYFKQASYDECGLVMRGCTVGDWDKADGIWLKTL